MVMERGIGRKRFNELSKGCMVVGRGDGGCSGLEGGVPETEIS